MKKLFIFLVVCLSSLGMNAQNNQRYYAEEGEKSGTFTLPESEKYLLLKFDFSNTVFEDKYNEADWALLNGKESWEEAKQDALGRIVELMNREMTKTRIIMVLDKMGVSGNSGIKPNYTLFITPISYFKNGKNKSNYVIKNNETGEILGIIETKGSGGHFGSLGNLLGDGFEKSAPYIALKIAKYNKIKKKEKE